MRIDKRIKLNNSTVRIIKELLRDELLSQGEIAFLADVSQQTISKIYNKKIWSHVT